MTRHDLHRIAFVTRRFEMLQGLRPAATGAGLLLIVALFQLLPAPSGKDPRLQIALLVNTAVIFLARALDGYYRDTFGAVRTGDSGRAAYRAGPHADPLSLLVVVGLLIDSTEVARSVGIPSCAALILAGHSLWILVRDGAHRPHYLLGLAGGLLALTVAAPVLPAGDGRLSARAVDSLLMSCGLIGLAILATGLIDHHLLTLSMSRRARGGGGRVIPCSYLGGMRAFASAAGLAASIALAVMPPTKVPPLAPLLLPILVGLVVLVAMFMETRRTVRGFNELMRAPETRLVARLTGHARAGEAADGEPLPSAVIPPDLLGHVVLPLAIGVGLFVDGTWRNLAFPSMAALALAASHLHITIRDWTHRKHYLLGVCAGLACVLDQMTTASNDPTAWALRSAMLVSAAMLVEGLLDYRLELRAAPRAESEAHADTV